MDEVGTRIAWLLRVSRAAIDEGSLEDFAGRLATHGSRVTAAELAEVERGETEAAPGVIGAYESVLALPTGRLLGPAVATSRVLRGRPLSPVRVLPVPEVRRELDRIAEVIRHGRPTGADWISFAHLLTQPDGALLPGFLEDEWLYQLVDELSRSVAETYLSRAEALARIMGEELHAQRLVALIRDRVHEAGAQASVDVLSIWGSGRDTASVDAAIVLLLDDDAGIRRGASVALLRRLARDRLTAARQDQIAETLRRQAHEDPESVGDDAIALSHRISPALGAELETARGRPVAPPEPDDGPTVEVFLDAVAQTLDLTLDPVLRTLLREAFTTTHPERRPRAALMLAASPFAPVIGQTAVGLMRHPDPAVTHRAARLVINLPKHIDTTELCALAESDDAVVSGHALIALSHGLGVPTAVDLLPRLIDPATAGASIYAAGMSQHPVLHAARQNHAVSPDVRRAAQWWIDRGGRVSDEEAVAS